MMLKFCCLASGNKTRTSKVGAISKAQKAQNIFFEKLKFSNFFFFRKVSHKAEKCERETLWDLLTYIQLQNIKNSKGGPLETLKIFRKKVAVPKKNRKGGPFSSSGFVGYV